MESDATVVSLRTHYHNRAQSVGRLEDRVCLSQRQIRDCDGKALVVPKTRSGIPNLSTHLAESTLRGKVYGFPGY